jgi:hypothetical protein
MLLYAFVSPSSFFLPLGFYFLYVSYVSIKIFTSITCCELFYNLSLTPCALHFLSISWPSTAHLHYIALIPITSHSLVQFHHRMFYSFSWLFCVQHWISIIMFFVIVPISLCSTIYFHHWTFCFLQFISITLCSMSNVHCFAPCLIYLNYYVFYNSFPFNLHHWASNFF